jgi:toxin-antitoxin system PIN domain toxin
MILVDANLLVYAKVRDFPQHARAHAWLDAQLGAHHRVGLPWPSLLTFHRVVTHPDLFPRPLAPAESWAQVEAWLGRPNVWTPVPTDRHAVVLGELVRSSGVRGNLAYDAHLAALAVEHGLTLCSSDGDFGRFAGLRWQNPLAAADR